VWAGDKPPRYESDPPELASKRLSSVRVKSKPIGLLAPEA
jgi:hypothetical protein